MTVDNLPQKIAKAIPQAINTLKVFFKAANKLSQVRPQEQASTTDISVQQAKNKNTKNPGHLR
ncbi:hypothetical protein [Rickettsiales endosymbiont of Stachyamoeba lipophora]|uniref:hypothetical protein n=1 Tax=Rickettsiales endosymbiont of Stachyamoeba lipophora TaxID=2486578 RepID=UPI000F64E12B|nr:hypothetical protein [Rickettsiales endosymbiont of Stachyamoeba lipophora]AZL15560.1 hypothetical protein EF513_03205 [Rickettsiales endosymbiont of Stachyamoeba lipophora]